MATIETSLKYLFLKKSTLGKKFSKENGGETKMPLLMEDVIILKNLANMPGLLSSTSVIFLLSSAIFAIASDDIILFTI